MVLFVCGSAFAAAPTASVVGTGTVEGSVSVGLAPADLRARLRDPTFVRDVNDGGVSVKVETDDGSCLVAAFTAPNLILTVHYRVRQCGTADGWGMSLVDSEELAEYSSTWTITPEGDGSLLTYRIHLAPKVPLPDTIVSRSLQHNVLGLLEHFASKYPPAG